MRIKIGMGARPCPTCGSLSNHTPGSLTCVTLRCMEAESKVKALQEAVCCLIAYINIPYYSIGKVETTVLEGVLESPAVAEALKGGKP